MHATSFLPSCSVQQDALPGDDALTAGLSYTARLIAISTLVAIQERRVLIYVSRTAQRWCGRALTPLAATTSSTHCTIPRNLSDTSKWSTRGSSFGYEAARPQSKAHVGISTSQVHRSTFWYKFHPSVKLYSAIYDLFFKPRPCDSASRRVHDACSLASPWQLRRGPRPLLGRKRRNRGARLPVLTEYLPATEALLAYANVSHLLCRRQRRKPSASLSPGVRSTAGSCRTRKISVPPPTPLDDRER